MRLILSPYAHELHYSGNRCADDCPACRWVEERERRLGRLRKSVQAESRVDRVTSVREKMEVHQPA